MFTQDYFTPMVRVESNLGLVRSSVDSLEAIKNICSMKNKFKKAKTRYKRPSYKFEISVGKITSNFV